jgi:F-type H+-transporting ATPase subunit a
VKKITNFLFAAVFIGSFCAAQNAQAQAPHTETPAACESAHAHKEGEKYSITPTIMHHIGNSNEFELWHGFAIPLPVIVYSPANGLLTCMSSKFEEGTKSYNGYVLNHGVVNYAAGLPDGEQNVTIIHKEEEEAGKPVEKGYACLNGTLYPCEKASTLVKGTSFYDFSISKNVVGMLIAVLLLVGIFAFVTKGYKTNKGLAPTGVQSLMEVIVVFIRDEVAIPMIGKHKYERFLPYLLTTFFFILANNLLGLIPFYGVNVTGNIGTTIVLGVIAFLVTNINGNRHYWGHILAMPGVPKWMLIILTPVEIIGVFTKPISLFIRLFANITAGHVIILSLVGLIFVFGNAGQSLTGSFAGMALAVPFTLFMNIIELVVAFIQAFIFTMLTASYIGGATEEAHH